jgi:hypothetical protein
MGGLRTKWAERRLEMTRGALTLLSCASALVACTSTPQTEPGITIPPDCTAGQDQLEVRGCGAGIPPDHCGEGFVANGTMGCEAIMPAQACGPGLLAIPGQSECRELSACGSGTWGDIPVETDTQYVDGAYGGGASDGSAQQPWTTITDGVAAAVTGAAVAIAAGTYGEDILIDSKPVHLWGRCPTMVEISGTEAQLAAVEIRGGADGSEIHGLSITGDSGGVFLSGSQDVIVEASWVHDTAGRGIALQDNLGAPSVRILGSVVEQATDIGVHLVGGEATVENSSLRDTRENSAYATGYGISVQPSDDTGATSTAVLRRCVMERNHTASMLLVASEGTVEDCLFRDTEPADLSARDGVAIVAQDEDGLRSSLTVTQSVFSNNYSRAIALVGSDGTFEAVQIEDTKAQQWDARLGEGIAIINSQTESAAASISISTIERNIQSGVIVRGSTAAFELVLVRDTEPRPEDMAFGRGVAVIGEAAVGMAAAGTFDACLLENNRAFGIYVADGTATVDSTMIVGTQVQGFDGDYGDAIGLATREDDLPATSVAVTGSRLESNVRAGALILGASLTLGSSSLECNARDLLGLEEYLGTAHPMSFDDLGQNRCGCGGAERSCKVVAP